VLFRSLLKKYKYIILILVLFILSIYLIRASQSIKAISFQEEWYPKSSDDKYIWMRNNGTITLYNEKNIEKEFLFTFDTISVIKDREVDVYLNSQKIDFFWSFNIGNKISIPLKLKPKSNNLEFRISVPCTRETPDIRCRSIGIANFSLSEIKEEILFSENWYPKSSDDKYIWMRNNGTIIYYNPYSVDQNKTLNTTLYGYYIPREIFLEMNNQKIREIKLKPTEESIFLMNITLVPGISIIKFFSKEDCLVIKEVENIPDIKCLSLGIKYLEIK